ncbi:C4-dicarboxylate ABC transporter [Psychromonas sp. psych-6C06]|uniref:anaerobic C4-dicarboxylate transporter n=1 Tax=Psychromonas sp. psych-6C06 TaxID=2058089 RepID=UPI000C33A8ED|nr:anaerobic C4-dicarboxylate transporter [Psychromonas sp. psych-6C06]PKF63739.1 C4-dicarboxylate ABC transporter [Psychromonas sp. psych-6C06]
MLWLQLATVLVFIFIGARLGGIGIGYAGGAGVIVLALSGMETSMAFIPVEVILIIMSVIATIAAMQRAGGLDYLVHLSERMLRKHPQYITFAAPIVTYFMTLLAGTGHTAFSTLPVIAEVAKEQGIRPSKPLSIAVVASQVAITASPISAAVVAFAAMLQPMGVSYLQLLLIAIPSTFVAVMIGAIIANLLGKPLLEDSVYQERLKEGLIKQRERYEYKPTSNAKFSVYAFVISIILVVTYAILLSGTIENPTIGRSEAIMSIMLATAGVIATKCKLNVNEITQMPTFRAGMCACICVLGVAWLGSTFVNGHIDDIKNLSGALLASYPWMLALVLFFASMLLYSQGATTAALMPAALAMGVAPVAAIASFAAVSALFVLPTYPTLLAAIEMDDTGSTRIGRYVFDHPFLLPGIVTISASVMIAFVIGNIVIS